MKFIIDGYNVIHRIEQLKGKLLRSQREGLIRLLENAQAQHRRFKDVTVVFDGQKDVLAPRINSTIKIIFTKGKSADKKIKEMVEGSSFARDIGVVSDDRQIRYYVSSLRAKKISVREFLKEIHPSGEKAQDFKLDEEAAAQVNRELEQIWLNK